MAIRATHLILLIPVVYIILSSCGNAETKADAAAGKIGVDTLEKMIVEKKDEKNTSSSSVKENESANVLANIDKFLVSEVKFDQPGASGGIVNGIVRVTNTLKDISIEKAIVEVSIVSADDKAIKTDYYTIINIGPGETKLAKLPNTSRGTKVISHIVKIKSDTLTGGEMILTGSHYAPK